MKLVFADTPLPTEVTKTIFLAGPNPRYKDGDPVLRTWRHDVLEVLEKKGYDGHVFIPTPIGSFYGKVVENAVSDYDHQVEWEDAAMMRADVILMWVDRTATLRGMTTNIEFGRYLDSGRLIFGYPETADGCKYMEEQIIKRRKEAYKNLDAIVDEALWRIGNGSERSGGEVLVPHVVWRSNQFQEWYTHMFSGDSQGNELRGFDIKTILCFNNRRSKITDEREIFGFAAHVNIWVDREKREKSNEWIFSRTSNSYVIPYYENPQTSAREYVMVREFRVPANNEAGYIFELPGGASTKLDVSPLETARDELFEETGIDISKDELHRFKVVGNRQTFATFSTNRIFATKIRLTEEEMNLARKRAAAGTQMGADDGERITLHIVKDTDLLNPDSETPVDWSTLGLIWSAHQHYDPQLNMTPSDGSDFM